MISRLLSYLAHFLPAPNAGNRFEQMRAALGALFGLVLTAIVSYGLLGKTAPAYVALPALPVTKANLADAWSQVYHKPVTDKIKKSM